MHEDTCCAAHSCFNTSSPLQLKSAGCALGIACLSKLTDVRTAGTCAYAFQYLGGVFGTALIGGVSGSNLAKCLDLCSSTQRCQTAVLTTSNTCYLYSTLAGARTSDYSYSVVHCGDNGAILRCMMCIKHAAITSVNVSCQTRVDACIAFGSQ